MEMTFLHKSPACQEKERTALPKRFKFFQERYQITFIHEITEKNLIDYVDFLEKSVALGDCRPSTAQSNLTMVKKVFNFLKKKKRISFNPSLEIGTIPVSKKDRVRDVTFTKEEVEKIIKAEVVNCPIDIKRFFLIAYYTGARIGEILHMEWSDIKDGIWNIHHKPNCPTKYGLGWIPKCGTERKVPLHETAQEVLKGIRKNPSVGYQKNDSTLNPAWFIFTVKDHNPENKTGRRRVDSISKSWNRLLKAAGLYSEKRKNFVRHDIRRTFNVEARATGLTSEQRSNLLGHSIAVNESHYEGTEEDNVLLMRANKSPANNRDHLNYL